MAANGRQPMFGDSDFLEDSESDERRLTLEQILQKFETPLPSAGLLSNLPWDVEVHSAGKSSSGSAHDAVFDSAGDDLSVLPWDVPDKSDGTASTCIPCGAAAFDSGNVRTALEAVELPAPPELQSLFPPPGLDLPLLVEEAAYPEEASAHPEEVSSSGTTAAFMVGAASSSQEQWRAQWQPQRKPAWSCAQVPQVSACEAEHSSSSQSQPLDLPPSAVLPDEAPTIGTAGHPISCGPACRYARRKGGCREGPRCLNCHYCKWRRALRDEGEDEDRRHTSNGDLGGGSVSTLERLLRIQLYCREKEIVTGSAAESLQPPDRRATEPAGSSSGLAGRLSKLPWDLPPDAVLDSTSHSLGPNRNSRSSIDPTVRDGSPRAWQPPASFGSLGHPEKCAPACKYLNKLAGCKDGLWCANCHVCQWRRAPQVRPIPEGDMVDSPEHAADGANLEGDPAALPIPGYAEIMPSTGSVGHPDTCGTACKYARRKAGCRDGSRCTSCHLCRWSRVPLAGESPTGAAACEATVSFCE